MDNNIINSLEDFDYSIKNNEDIHKLLDYIFYNIDSLTDLQKIINKYDAKNIIKKKLLLSKFLFPKHYPNIKVFAEKSAENGYYDCFSYIYELGWKLKLKNFGLTELSLETDEFIKKNNIRLDLGRNIYKSVLIGRNLNCFELLIKNNYIIEPNELNLIIKLDLHKQLKFIEENTNMTFTFYSYLLAIRYNSPHCFKYFYQLNLRKNRNISIDISMLAVKNGEVGIIKFLHKYNFPLHEEIAIQALFNNKLDCFNYIQNNLGEKYKINMDF